MLSKLESENVCSEAVSPRQCHRGIVNTQYEFSLRLKHDTISNCIIYWKGNVGYMMLVSVSLSLR